MRLCGDQYWIFGMVIIRNNQTNELQRDIFEFMSWQILLLINLAAASVREYLNKKVADRVSPFVGLFYICFFALILFYGCFFLFYHAFPRFDLLLSLTGIILIAGFISYFAALKISLSQSILFQSYSILITIVLSAIYLGESKYFDFHTATGLKVIIGILLSFIALWSLLHQKSKKKEQLEKKWFVYILSTIVFLGVGSFFTIFYIHRFSPLEVIINQNNVMVPLLFLFAVIRREKILIGSRMLKATAVNAFVSTIAVIAFYQALLLTPVAKFYPLQQLSLVIITMFTGVIFYKEKDLFSGTKLVGMALGLVGMVLLVMS